MITIYKYDLVSVIDLISGTKTSEFLKLPTGARVLSVGIQKDIICAWILLDNEIEATNDLYIQFVGTGWPIKFPQDVPNPIFVDTISLYDGDFMYHVFMGELQSNWNVPIMPEQEPVPTQDNYTLSEQNN